jgi:hypothetical protein
MFRDYLNLVNKVQVVRKTQTSDGMGGYSVTSVLTTLSRAALWKNGIGGREQFYRSGGQINTSSHTLAIEPGTYTFTLDDANVLYNGQTFEIKNKGEVTEDVDGNPFFAMVALESVQ